MHAPDDQLCPVCKGMGWLALAVDVGHPRFGDTLRCPVCGEHRQVEYLRESCRLSPEMQTWTFETTPKRAVNAQAWDTAKRLSAAPAWFLTLQGGYGVGKTRLLACLVNAGRAAKYTSIYLTTSELLDHLRAAYAPDAPTAFDEMWEAMTNARILALDEVDRFAPTDWAREKFFELVDQRYRSGQDHLTAFATNADLDALPGYLASRLQDRRGRVCHIAGGDMRQVQRG
jgi:DNA replication protein DnaC